MSEYYKLLPFTRRSDRQSNGGQSIPAVTAGPVTTIGGYIRPHVAPPVDSFQLPCLGLTLTLSDQETSSFRAAFDNDGISEKELYNYLIVGTFKNILLFLFFGGNGNKIHTHHLSCKNMLFIIILIFFVAFPKIFLKKIRCQSILN